MHGRRRGSAGRAFPFPEIWKFQQKKAIFLISCEKKHI